MSVENVTHQETDSQPKHQSCKLMPGTKARDTPSLSSLLLACVTSHLSAHLGVDVCVNSKHLPFTGGDGWELIIVLVKLHTDASINAITIILSWSTSQPWKVVISLFKTSIDTLRSADQTSHYLPFQYKAYNLTTEMLMLLVQPFYFLVIHNDYVYQSTSYK